MILAFHRRRFARFVGDLEVHVPSLVVRREGAEIFDDAEGRALRVVPRNLTEAEGLVSAIKLAAALDPLLGKARALVEALGNEEANHGGLLSRDTLVKAGALRLELSAWGDSK